MYGVYVCSENMKITVNYVSMTFISKTKVNKQFLPILILTITFNVKRLNTIAIQATPQT